MKPLAPAGVPYHVNTYSGRISGNCLLESVREGWRAASSPTRRSSTVRPAGARIVDTMRRAAPQQLTTRLSVTETIVGELRAPES